MPTLELRCPDGEEWPGLSPGWLPLGFPLRMRHLPKVLYLPGFAASTLHPGTAPSGLWGPGTPRKTSQDRMGANGLPLSAKPSLHGFAGHLPCPPRPGMNEVKLKRRSETKESLSGRGLPLPTIYLTPAMCQALGWP